MKKVMHYRFKNDAYGFFSQAIPLVSFISFLLLFHVKFSMLLCLIIIISLLLRYPHEFLHWIAAYFLGIEAEINFKRINSTCTPKSDMNAKQYFIFILAPFIGLNFILLGIIIVFHFLAITYIEHIFLGVILPTQATYAFDIAGAYYTIKFKNGIFRDNGNNIDVYSND